MFLLAVNEVFRKRIFVDILYIIAVIFYGDKIGWQFLQLGFFLLSERLMFNTYSNYKRFVKKTLRYPIHYFALLSLNYFAIIIVLVVSLIILKVSIIESLRAVILFNILAFLGAYFSNTSLIVSNSGLQRFLIRVLISLVSYSIFSFLITYFDHLGVVCLLFVITLALSLYSFGVNRIPLFRTQII